MRILRSVEGGARHCGGARWSRSCESFEREELSRENGCFVAYWDFGDETPVRDVVLLTARVVAP